MSGTDQGGGELRTRMVDRHGRLLMIRGGRLVPDSRAAPSATGQGIAGDTAEAAPKKEEDAAEDEGERAARVAEIAERIKPQVQRSLREAALLKALDAPDPVAAGSAAEAQAEEQASAVALERAKVIAEREDQFFGEFYSAFEHKIDQAIGDALTCWPDGIDETLRHQAAEAGAQAAAGAASRAHAMREYENARA